MVLKEIVRKAYDRLMLSLTCCNYLRCWHQWHREDRMLRYHDEIQWGCSNKVLVVVVIEEGRPWFDYVIFCLCISPEGKVYSIYLHSITW